MEQDSFLVTSVGSTWQLYRCDKLRLALVGELPSSGYASGNHDIGVLASTGEFVFAAYGSRIAFFHRQFQVRRLDDSPVMVFLCKHAS